MRDRAKRVAKSFSLPKPPQPEPGCEEQETAAASAKTSSDDIAPAALRIHECKKCLRIFALKKTLSMHAKICSERSR